MAAQRRGAITGHVARDLIPAYRETGDRRAASLLMLFPLAPIIQRHHRLVADHPWPARGIGLEAARGRRALGAARSASTTRPMPVLVLARALRRMRRTLVDLMPGARARRHQRQRRQAQGALRRRVAGGACARHVALGHAADRREWAAVLATVIICRHGMVLEYLDSFYLQRPPRHEQTQHGGLPATTLSGVSTAAYVRPDPVTKVDPRRR